MILDGCIFWNEIDMLDLRLHILDEVVDYFIVVESMEAIGSKNRKLEPILPMADKIIEEFGHKIVYLLLPSLQPQLTDSSTGWQQGGHNSDLPTGKVPAR